MSFSSYIHLSLLAFPLPFWQFYSFLCAPDPAHCIILHPCHLHPCPQYLCTIMSYLLSNHPHHAKSVTGNSLAPYPHQSSYFDQMFPQDPVHTTNYTGKSQRGTIPYQSGVSNPSHRTSSHPEIWLPLPQSVTLKDCGTCHTEVFQPQPLHYLAHQAVRFLEQQCTEIERSVDQGLLDCNETGKHAQEACLQVYKGDLELKDPNENTFSCLLQRSCEVGHQLLAKRFRSGKPVQDSLRSTCHLAPNEQQFGNRNSNASSSRPSYISDDSQQRDYAQYSHTIMQASRPVQQIDYLMPSLASVYSR